MNDETMQRYGAILTAASNGKFSLKSFHRSPENEQYHHWTEKGTTCAPPVRPRLR